MQRYNETQCSYGYHQELFPIVQGSVYRDLRKFSAETIASYPSGGYAIGGLSVGEPAEVMYEMTELVCGILPREKPRYLMGVGTPVNILENIALGIDMFDCVMPTRNWRNGMNFTAQGIINIRNEKWKNDFSLLDEEDTCFVDRQYSKAYLRHLFISNEMNGPMIVSMHNLAFYLWLMKQARLHIAEGTFASWKTVMIKQLSTRL
jgi:queuine tRNA-ribosyltransferase